MQETIEVIVGKKKKKKENTQELYSNNKWQTVMAEITVNYQQICWKKKKNQQSDALNSMAAVFVGNMLFPSSSKLCSPSFTDRLVSIRDWWDLFH